MDQKTVEKLEVKIEEAIAEIIVKMGLKKLPLLPARHTMHLMAKAAVTVYERRWRISDERKTHEHGASTNPEKTRRWSHHRRCR
jgi:hypothetical protein